jgi:hypothetical protein
VQPQQESNNYCVGTRGADESARASFARSAATILLLGAALLVVETAQAAEANAAA